jgi:hypothetical protein
MKSRRGQTVLLEKMNLSQSGDAGQFCLRGIAVNEHS